MKKLILLTVLLSFGCSKNCDDLENAAIVIGFIMGVLLALTINLIKKTK